MILPPLALWNKNTPGYLKDTGGILDLHSIFIPNETLILHLFQFSMIISIYRNTGTVFANLIYQRYFRFN